MLSRLSLHRGIPYALSPGNYGTNQNVERLTERDWHYVIFRSLDCWPRAPGRLDELAGRDGIVEAPAAHPRIEGGTALAFTTRSAVRDARLDAES
jgi:hypothetical protein